MRDRIREERRTGAEKRRILHTRLEPEDNHDYYHHDYNQHYHDGY